MDSVTNEKSSTHLVGRRTEVRELSFSMLPAYATNSRPPDPPTPGPGADHLDSWKEIASHLGRDVRTAQRWEKREGLPVHRHAHLKGSTVYAFRSEIDGWLRGRAETPIRSQSRRKPSKSRTKAWNAPPPRLTKHMLATLRVWLAIVEQGALEVSSSTEFAMTKSGG